MTQFLQAVVNGLLEGGLLALVAVGFSLAWGVMNIINLAHGAFVMMGAYTAWQLNVWFGVDPLLGMVASIAVLFITGYVIQRALLNLIVNGPVLITLLLTFGLQLLLVDGMAVLFTADYRAIETSYALRSLDLSGVRVPVGRLLAFVVAVMLTLLLVMLMTRTRTGLAIGATGMDRAAARLMGIPVRHVFALTFGIGAACAGAAGAMIVTVGTVTPTDANRYTMLSFVVAVLGGLGNMYGALVGGVVLGLVEALAGQYVSPTLVNAFALVVLLAVVVLRPSGLLGRAFYGRRQEV